MDSQSSSIIGINKGGYKRYFLVITSYSDMDQLLSGQENVQIDPTRVPGNPDSSCCLWEAIRKKIPLREQSLLDKSLVSEFNFSFSKAHDMDIIVQNKLLNLFLFMGLIQPSNIPIANDH